MIVISNHTSATTIYEKVIAISDLIRLKKQYGTLLVLAPTLWSLFIASDGSPSFRLFMIFLVGTFLMRSAGCVVNDIADRGFDRFVERTKERPLASGRLTLREAVITFVVLSSCAFVLVLFLNTLTIILSVVAIFLAALYPFVKRVSHLPQVFLGMAFGWGSIMAWSAVQNTVGVPAILIFVANIFWSTAYDTIYALMDIEDDIKIGVKSTAIFFGKDVYTALHVLYVIAAIFLVATGIVSHLGTPYFVTVIACSIAFESMVFLLKQSPVRARAFRIFVANAALGLVLLAGIIVDYSF